VHWDGSAMVGLLLTVGVSVDFTTHITYHYYKEQLPADATTEESIDRLRYVDPLASVKHTHTHILRQLYIEAGWATVQGIVCTTLGIMPLIAVDAHIVRTMWIVQFIAAVLGLYTSESRAHTCIRHLVHITAMLFLPTIFITFTRCARDKTREHRIQRIGAIVLCGDDVWDE
jgi:hypothetical protein